MFSSHHLKFRYKPSVKSLKFETLCSHDTLSTQYNTTQYNAIGIYIYICMSQIIIIIMTIDQSQKVKRLYLEKANFDLVACSSSKSFIIIRMTTLIYQRFSGCIYIAQTFYAPNKYTYMRRRYCQRSRIFNVNLL